MLYERIEGRKLIKDLEKQASFLSIWAIHPETFTNLIGFVKNHLVK